MSQTFVIRAIGQQPLLNFRELWAFRYLFFILVWRALRVRYQQTVIGVAWALLQPIMYTIVFTVIFGMIVAIPTNGQPYAIFVMSGLSVWLFVAQSFNQASSSIFLNAHLIGRIYFPRMILIFAVMAVALVDFLLAFSVLVVLMVWYGIAPTIGALYFLPMMLLMIMTILGLALWLSALYVPYRDVGQLLPFMTTLWMFLSPVIYPSALLPAKYQFLYALNPVVVVIDTGRWAFAGGPPPEGWMVVVSCVVAVFLCVTGYWFFRRQEATFADVV
jgi:lipopolysaccharide transport system permease protein